MTAHSLHQDARLQRLEQASLWLQRMREPAADDRRVEDWLDWYQRDPLNKQAFDEISAIWDLGGRVDLDTPDQPQPMMVTQKPQTSRRMALAASVAGLGLALVAGGAWWADRTADSGRLGTSLSSPVGVNAVETLADGSVLDLGGGTRVTVEIGPQQRRLDLHEGELFVAVHPDPSRPFSVDAGKLTAIATGTAFNVLRTEARTVVTVVEGSVAAHYDNPSTTIPEMHLQPGQQLVYSHASHSAEVRQANPRDVIAWRSGMLHFQNEPLSEVAASLNRYASTPIVIEDPQVRAMSFLGTARTDHIDSWLEALPHALPVSVQRLADDRRLIGARPAITPD